MAWKSVFATVVTLGLLAAAAHGQEQQPPAAQISNEAALARLVQQLGEQVAELRQTVTEMQSESAEYRRETAVLRQELQAALARLPQPGTTAVAPAQSVATEQPAPAAPASVDDRLRRLKDDLDLLSGKVDDQYQTKVESGSKYRMRLSGILLLNLFGNGGAVDSADVPFIADPALAGQPEGSFGGTVRQSQLRFELFGPHLAGARTYADLNMDFAGGFPTTENGVALGIARIRTATVHLDWQHTSLIAGQDAPFISALSPTSLATLAQPALSYAGNLWTWMPQIRIEHRIATGSDSELSLQGGVLDPFTGEIPPVEFDRVPQAGENSRQPAFATRIGWSSGHQDRAFRFGIGGYYSRQNWSFERNVDGWAGTADWSIPLGKPFTLSGEFYRGRAVGGLGGGIGQTVVFFGPPAQPTSNVLGLDSLGGWTQLKYQATERLEFNAAVGQDNPYAAEFRDAALSTNVYNLAAVRNRAAMFNFIYRLRSNLLFSTEYRHIQTFRLSAPDRSADHVNFAIGVLF